MDSRERLNEMMKQIADRLEVDLDDLGDGYYGLEYPLESERSQAVGAFVQADELGDEWLMAYSEFGPVDKLDLRELLSRNFSPGYAFLAVNGDDAMVCANSLFQSADVDLLDELLGSVAAWADELEEEFFGTDET